MASLVTECGPHCHSRYHARELNIAVTKGDLRQVQLFLRQCHNAGLVSDHFGRTTLHVAASCNKWEVLLWLLENCTVEINAKDSESGWTALHRATFYGQLMAARMLISVRNWPIHHR